MKALDEVTIFALVALVLCAAYGLHIQNTEIEQLRAEPADTVYVEVAQEVDLSEAWGIACRYVPDTASLTAGDQ